MTENGKSPDKLVYMANPIGKFWVGQSEDKAPAAIAEHIKKFWDPRMRNATYYVAMGFIQDEAGELVALDPVEVHSLAAAVTRARSLASTKVGAIAFSRTGDPNHGELQDAVVLFSAGEVPDDAMAIRLAQEGETDDAGAGESGALHVTWRKRASARRREILVPSDATSQNLRPIRVPTGALVTLLIQLGLMKWTGPVGRCVKVATLARPEPCELLEKEAGQYLDTSRLGLSWRRHPVNAAH